MARIYFRDLRTQIDTKVNPRHRFENAIIKLYWFMAVSFETGYKRNPDKTEEAAHWAASSVLMNINERLGLFLLLQTDQVKGGSCFEPLNLTLVVGMVHLKGVSGTVFVG
jgi:hypothetical protein